MGNCMFASGRELTDDVTVTRERSGAGDDSAAAADGERTDPAPGPAGDAGEVDLEASAAAGGVAPASAQARAMAFKEPMDRNFWRAVSAELLAMFLFVFVCVGCALSTLGVAEGANPLASYNATLSISLCFGLTIFVLAHCFGPISGAHINPAVTFALVLTRQCSVLRGALYVLAQCVGSVAASGLLMIVMGLTPDTMGGSNLLSGPDETRVVRGFVLEAILTFLLCFTVLATVDPSRQAAHLGPLAIGMAVCVAHLIAVPITGCGINPARSLGPAIFQEAAQGDLWVFLLAPFIGSAIAALFYHEGYAT